MVEGKDFVGVGVGAIVFDKFGKVLLSKRGKNCRNEIGLYEFPGGGLEFGENLEEAVKREILEECGIDVLVKNQMATFNHILPNEGQHWVSVVYICNYQSGELTIKEPDKCSELIWVNFDKIDLNSLTSVSKDCWNYLNENWDIVLNLKLLCTKMRDIYGFC